MARSKTEESSGEYTKSAEEWEILGELAERLHHFPEAVEAYQSCLRVRFSPKAMRGVLRMYEGQGRVGEVLQCVIRLVAWQYRWYSEVSLARLFPTYEPPRSAKFILSSSRHPSFTPSASSLKAKARSKCAVLFKQPVYRNRSWTSRIFMWNDVLHLGRTVATAEWSVSLGCAPNSPSI